MSIITSRRNRRGRGSATTPVTQITRRARQSRRRGGVADAALDGMQDQTLTEVMRLRAFSRATAQLR
jgi:hypothetical protein